ncbi:MAG: VRR-NUC domain-containing protein [Clostridia bacterium]|nr:VRR-NUC domain-containing protein [Clostridia bacterium]
MRPVSVQNEEGEQIAVCDWLRWHQLVFLHVPNEAKRSQAAGHREKLMGLQKGFPDLLVLEPRGRYHGLAIEMKAIGGRVRPEQKEWIEMLKAKGYAASVAYGADHAIALIQEYLKVGEQDE